ncbi:hypothetical protein GQ53DRAFT_828408 [Thozetella sp. PMI_491]|nr:hypothetical protein GQ53DRAFT_828408 [Thozetella sp. PMI_491]
MNLGMLVAADISFGVGTSGANITCNSTTNNTQPSDANTIARLRLVNSTNAGADIVIRNASIFTAAQWSSSRATGFAVKNGKFVAVTSNDAELDPFITCKTTVKDMAGAAVVPGMFDAHIHHISGGKLLSKQLQFSSTLSLDEVLAAVDAYATNLTSASAWVTGGNWGSTLLGDVSTTASLKRLDDVSHGHPVLLSDDSYHNAWANTAALKAAGIYTEGVTGLLIENAKNPVQIAQALAEPETLETLKEESLAAWKLLHSYGVTGIQDAAVTQPQLEAMVALDDENNLKGWISTCLLLTGASAVANFSEAEFDQYAHKVYRDRVRTDFTKLFLDGVPTTQTGGFLEAYLPSSEHGCNYHGLVYNSSSELVETLRKYRGMGRHTKIHCTGDWSVQVAMDAFEVLRLEGSTQKYQIAHGQFVTPEDRKRMKLLDITADISPFLWYPGIIPLSITFVLPEEMATHMQPNRDLLDLGVLVAGGSDWSVGSVPNPWEGIGGLVTREDPTGQFPGTLWEEQAVSVEEAIRIFSINGARAAGLDDVVGSIEVGKAANFVFIDRDPFKINATEIGNTKVLRTYVAGEMVYSSSG